MVDTGLNTDLQTLPTCSFLTCIPLSLLSKQHTLNKCFPKFFDEQINFCDYSHENVEFGNWKSLNENFPQLIMIPESTC